MQKHFTESRLVVLLYLLMRDNLPPGVIAEAIEKLDLVRDSVSGYELSNGFLGQYAECLAQRLQEEKP